MKRTISFFILFVGLSFPFVSQAQRGEIGVNAGASYYIGDLNPLKHFNNPKLAGGLHYKANMNKRVSLRAGFMYARAEAYDSESSNVNQINRNLHFRSNIFELSGMVEINFFDYLIGKDDYNPYTPYVFFGLAYFNMNPKAEYNGEFIELQPLGTEGQETSYNQDKKYRINQMSIPFGLGIKFNVTKKMAIAAEYGLRKTFTDYLDDVSGTYADPTILLTEAGSLAVEMADQSLNQEGANTNNAGVDRGNPYTKDWYAYAGITLSFAVFPEPPCGFFGKRRLMN